MRNNRALTIENLRTLVKNTRNFHQTEVQLDFPLIRIRKWANGVTAREKNSYFTVLTVLIGEEMITSH